jgi:hypothetical protein
MKYLHNIIWVLFAVVLVFYACQYIYLASQHHCLNILQIEIANKEKGRTLLESWYQEKIGTKTLLRYAQINTMADFALIIAYTGVMLIISYAIMQREANPFLNNLLRLNMLLAVIVGLLDILENIILLYDMYDYVPGNSFVSSQVPAYGKFLLIAYIIAVWFISLLRRRNIHPGRA